MLKFSISAADMAATACGSRWRSLGGRWVLGKSVIEPYDNVALESTAIVEDAALVVIVRERVRDSPRLPARQAQSFGTAGEHVKQTEDWAGDFVILRVDGEVVVTAGQWGAAPLYLSGDAKSFSGSWDIADLHGRLRVDELDARQVVAHLTLLTPYSSRTLFTRIRRLTERAQARWAPGETLRIRFPEHATHYRPREMRPDARPVEVYDALLSRAVTRRPLSGADVVVEVSGGTDSATVALSAARELSGGDLAAYGLLIGGPAGRQQIMRRSSLTALGGLRDHIVDANEYPPLAAGRTGRFGDPGEEPYRAAVAAALEIVDRPVVFTGIGGDELVALRPGEQPAAAGPRPSLPNYLSSKARELAEQLRRDRPETPVSVVPESALQASLVRAPTFLRAGRWAVAPLCNADLIRFGEWLPVPWRKGKRLPRSWLRARGVPDEVVWPHLRENFVPVMQHALRDHGLGQLHSLAQHGSVLVDLGYLDHAALVEQLSAASAAHRTGSPIDARLHELLVMERFVRALTGRFSQSKHLTQRVR